MDWQERAAELPISRRIDSERGVLDALTGLPMETDDAFRARLLAAQRAGVDPSRVTVAFDATSGVWNVSILPPPEEIAIRVALTGQD